MTQERILSEIDCLKYKLWLCKDIGESARIEYQLEYYNSLLKQNESTR